MAKALLPSSRLLVGIRTFLGWRLDRWHCDWPHCETSNAGFPAPAFTKARRAGEPPLLVGAFEKFKGKCRKARLSCVIDGDAVGGPRLEQRRKDN
jgi:hypothetical protein